MIAIFYVAESWFVDSNKVSLCGVGCTIRCHPRYGIKKRTVLWFPLTRTWSADCRVRVGTGRTGIQPTALQKAPCRNAAPLT